MLAVKRQRARERSRLVIAHDFAVKRVLGDGLDAEQGDPEMLAVERKRTGALLGGEHLRGLRLGGLRLRGVLGAGGKRGKQRQRRGDSGDAG